MRLDGKVAIIMGAGQGPGDGSAIGNGRATALLFAREGARVACVDRNIESAAETVAMIEAEGGTALAFAADVTDEGAVAKVIEQSHTARGALDILHNNVGISIEGGDCPLEDVDERRFHRIMDVNLLGTMYACKHAPPIMRAAGRSSTSPRPRSAGPAIRRCCTPRRRRRW